MLEFNINGRHAVVKKIKQEANILTISVDEKLYEVDIMKVGLCEYSLISNGMSRNIEVIDGLAKNLFSVNTVYNEFEVEVIDRKSGYGLSYAGDHGHHSLSIHSPMPGKVVKILVEPGDKVEAGQTVIILSAMKMENEFKAGKAGTVTKVSVSEGDVVDLNQLLVAIQE